MAGIVDTLQFNMQNAAVARFAEQIRPPVPHLGQFDVVPPLNRQIRQRQQSFLTRGEASS